MIADRMTSIARSCGLESRPKYPVFPSAFEPAALYLALALTASQKRSELPAPDLVLKRLAELGWLRAVAIRPGCNHGIGWLDFSTARFLGVSGIACFENASASSTRHSDVAGWSDKVFSSQLPGQEVTA